jgi:uncharacterized protein (TIGR02145 family)
MNVRIIIFFLFPMFALAQTPQKINFQSIMRNSSGEVVGNRVVNMRISILSGNSSGNNVFSETHVKTTDATGLISIEMGTGTLLSGVFSSIDWGNAAHFIKLEADFIGGTTYELLGTQELMSVPYALYADKSDTSVLNLTSRLATKLNVTDTSFLSDRIDAILTKTDTVSLSKRIDAKLTKTDTSFLSDRIDAILTKTDTVSLSKRIDAKLTKTDTASLSNRIDFKLTKTDTSFLSDRIDLKLTKTDTAFLSNRIDFKLTKTDTAFLSDRIDLKLTKTDTSFLSDRIDLKLTKTDTVSLSNRIDLKLTKTDTTFLSNRIDFKLTKTDTAFLSNRIDFKLTKTDTASLSNRIDFKLTKTDTAFLSNRIDLKLTKTDTSFLSDRIDYKLTKTDTASLSNRIDAKAPIYSPTFTGMVGGIDKIMVGLPNVDNTSDAGKPISTATQTSLITKVNTTDTADMLSAYLRKTDAIIIDLQNQVTLLSSYTSLLASGLVDTDGNNYPVVKIGNQIWMKENLRVSRYRNGDLISIVTDIAAWAALTTGGRTWYDNDRTTYENPYGNLYNWYAVTDNRGLCPYGWHAPTDAEWTILTTYLGGESVAGDKMKTITNAYWNDPNTGAINSSGFSALPGGYRDGVGSFNYIRSNAFFWSATESSFSYAWIRYLDSSNGNVNRTNYNKLVGASVRCLRD